LSVILKLYCFAPYHGGNDAGHIYTMVHCIAVQDFGPGPNSAWFTASAADTIRLCGNFQRIGEIALLPQSSKITCAPKLKYRSDNHTFESQL